MKLIFLLFFIPFTIYSQKENQISTTQKGIFIEQNNQGKFGIVNSNGDVLVPIINDYINEIWEGGGFFVYEKITVNGPDYKEGVIRFYDKNVKDVFNRTFTRINNAGENSLICYDKNLCGVFKKSGELIAPICFSEIISLDGKLFWFDVDASLRDSLSTILSTKTISESLLPLNVNIADRDGYQLFQGVFNQDGVLVCKGQFRIVQIITYDGNNSLFAVQNQNLFMENDGATNFALMNGKGELVSDYIYLEILNIDGQLIGEIPTETELKRVRLNNQGIQIK